MLSASRCRMLLSQQQEPVKYHLPLPTLARYRCDVCSQSTVQVTRRKRAFSDRILENSSQKQRLGELAVATKAPLWMFDTGNGTQGLETGSC